MHVVHIIARLKTYSGAEHHAFRYLQEALRRGDKVTLVSRYVAPELRPHLPAEVEVRTLRFAHRPSRFHFVESIADVFYSCFLFLLVPKGSGCDVYWNDNTLASLFLDSLRRPKLRIFLCLQLPHFAYGQTLLVARSYPPLSWFVPIFVPIYRWLDRLFARAADSIVTLSESVRRDCRRVYPRKAVCVVNPGVDPAPESLIDPSFVRHAYRVKSRHILVSAGKLIAKKNFPLFVEIVATLRKLGVDVSGVIIGAGPARRSIERAIARHSVRDACILAGHLADHQDVLRLISGASLYLYLERRVPFGLTPLEAGSVGVPVAAFAGGGVDETVVDGLNGHTLPEHWGATEIAGLLTRILANPDALRRQGQEGRRMAAERSWSRSHDEFARWIETRATEFRSNLDRLPKAASA